MLLLHTYGLCQTSMMEPFSEKKKCYSSENKFWEKLYPRYILIQLWHMIYIFDNYRYIWQWKHFQQHGNRTYLNCYLMTSIKNWKKILKANFAHRKGNNLNSEKTQRLLLEIEFSVFHFPKFHENEAKPLTEVWSWSFKIINS